MKRIPGLLAFLTLMSCLPTSCRPEMDFVESSFQSAQAGITSAPETVTMLFGHESGSASIDLSSNRSWDAYFVNDRAREWCSLSAVSGGRGTVTLTVQVTMNSDYDERSASILFTCGDVSRTIVVTQKQRNALLVTSHRVDVPQAGGTFLVEVQSNIDFTCALSYPRDEASGWLHDLGTKGLSQHVLTFQADENPTIEARQASLTVSSEMGQEVVTFYQDGEIPSIVISTHSVSLAPDGGSFEVQVRSNLDVEVLTPEEASWLQEVRTKTFSTNTYVFSGARNDTRTARSCLLVFRNAALSLADTVQVLQEYKSILLSGAEVLLPDVETDFPLLVDGDDPEAFRLEVPASWLEVSGFEKTADGLRYDLKASANPGGEERSAQICVYYKDFTEPDVVSVRQAESLPYFRFSTELREVAVPVLLLPDPMTFIFWGDGSWEPFREEAVHRYGSAGSHTVVVRGRWLPDIRFLLPASGTSFDFSKLRNNQ